MTEVLSEYTASTSGDANAVPPNRFIDRLLSLSMAWCELLVLAMMLVIAIDVTTRALFNWSWQMSEEIAGYLLVALAFSSLAAGVRDGTFLRVDFLFVKLSERTQRLLDGVYAVLGLIFVGVWTWQLGRLVWSSYTREMVSNGEYRVPLWIPQLIMPIGAALLFVMMGRLVWAWVTGANQRREGKQ